MFTPELATTALRTMHERWGPTVYGKYGFVDAFNPKTGWTDTDVIGINVGIILLSAENMRTGSVWRWFMRNSEFPLTLDRIGLRRYRKASTTSRWEINNVGNETTQATQGALGPRAAGG
jgi:hypothetical protein